MYLATYDFEIHYCKGAADPADGPSRRSDYRESEGPADIAWLPTFQNKLKNAFASALRSRGADIEAFPDEEYRVMFGQLSKIAQDPADRTGTGNPEENSGSWASKTRSSGQHT